MQEKMAQATPFFRERSVVAQSYNKNSLVWMGVMGAFSCVSWIVYASCMDRELIDVYMFTLAFGCLLSGSVFCLGYNYFTEWGRPNMNEISVGPAPVNPNRDSDAGLAVWGYLTPHYVNVPSTISYEMALQLMKAQSVKYAIAIDERGQITNVLSTKNIERSLSMQEREQTIVIREPRVLDCGASVGDAISIFIQSKQPVIPVRNVHREVIGVLVYDEVLEKLNEWTAA